MKLSSFPSLSNSIYNHLRVFRLTLYCIVLFVVSVNVLFAQSGTVIFSTAVYQTNIGTVLNDGTYSNDIQGIQLDIFGAINAGNATNNITHGSFAYFSDVALNLTHGGFRLIDLTFGTQIANESNLPKILVIKSHSGIGFSFKSIYVGDHLEGNYPLKFEGFLNGGSTGSVILYVNQSSHESTFDGENGLTPSIFNSVDEIRVTNMYSGEMVYGIFNSFNNITIGPNESSVLVPTVKTNPVTSISSSGATLNGAVIANNAETVVTFEYGTSTSYGNTVTATQSPINGTTLDSVSGLLTNLSHNTTYHFRIKAINTVGATYGPDSTFTTSAILPFAQTDPPSDTTAISATFNGTVNANNSVTTVFFHCLTCIGNDMLKATQSPVSGTSLTSVSYSLTDMQPGTTYIYRVVAINSAGVVYGSFTRFNTPEIKPFAQTGSPGDITGTSVTLNGNINVYNTVTVVTFEYGRTKSYGDSITFPYGIFYGCKLIPVNYSLTGLIPNAKYHYRIKARNYNGTTYGSDSTFSTLLIPPSVKTESPGNITGTSITLNGTVNANNAGTGASFEYGKNTSYGNTVNTLQGIIKDTITTQVSANLTNLQPNTIYHYRIIATNIGGVTYGPDSTFTTSNIAPIAQTGSASNISSNSATLIGYVSANNSVSDITFEYGSSIGYGNSATASQSPLTGMNLSEVNYTLAGLNENTTYYYRVKAVNAAGTTYGNNKTFTTNKFGIWIINALASTGGIISPSGNINISEGGNQTFTISANNGYEISDVIIDGISVGKISSYTFVLVSANHTISVLLKLLTGIEKANYEKKVFYPNPCMNGFTINTDKKSTTLCIYDINGSMVLSQLLTGKAYINTESLKAGIYVVKLDGEIYKLIKE